MKGLAEAPFDTTVLKSVLSRFANPLAKARALVADGTLIRLRRDLYCVAPEVSGHPVDTGRIANLLYGPSYVSFETALAGYGLIPERVVEIRSAVSGRAKSYATPLGRFAYRTVPASVFPIGVRTENGVLTASREKALCDFLDSRVGLRVTSPKSLKRYLEEDVRLDFDAFGSPDVSVFSAYAATGRKQGLFTALERMFS